MGGRIGLVGVSECERGMIVGLSICPLYCSGFCCNLFRLSGGRAPKASPRSALGELTSQFPRVIQYVHTNYIRTTIAKLICNTLVHIHGNSGFQSIQENYRLRIPFGSRP